MASGALIDRFLPAGFHASAARSFSRRSDLISGIGLTPLPGACEVRDKSCGINTGQVSVAAPSMTSRGQNAQSFAASAPICAYSVKEKEPLPDVLKRAGKRALGGGVPGAAAMGIQVVSLMWLRTTVNYQYRHGGTMKAAFKHLYKDGGIIRFYRGVGPALIQGPMSRFGDTAANAGSLALLDSYDATSHLPVGAKTAVASASAALFRIFLMPVDACKTTMQVEGKHGLSVLRAKMKVGGVPVLYHGALAASAATFVGHYPWFFTFNLLNERLPQYDELPKKLMRSAVIGFCSSAISDTCSNSIRVMKTTKQTSTEAITYPQALKMVLEKDGMVGLFGRGLKTKILANGMQGMLFTVLWRMGMDWWQQMEKA